VRLNDGFLPLHIACRYHECPDVIRLILKTCPEAARTQNSDGWLPLHIACGVKASTEVIEMLVESFPESVTVKNLEGNIPLYYADNDGLASQPLLLLLSPQIQSQKGNSESTKLHANDKPNSLEMTDEPPDSFQQPLIWNDTKTALLDLCVNAYERNDYE
jgi:ankyrin repeat protein